MSFNPINFWYFIIVLPILLISLLLISRLYKNEEKNHLFIIISLSILLFIIRLILVFFRDTIGIMPKLIDDAIFYSLLLGFGLLFTWYYLYRIEKSNFKDIGFKTENIKRSVFYGLIGIIPLIAMTPLIILLTHIDITFPPNISAEKIIISLSFSLLGAIYEEVMFRGIIQKHVKELVDNEWKIIIFTAVIFTLTHLFYLPFDYGIYYIFVFVMAVLLSWLRIHVDQFACAITHGCIVFLLIVLV